MERERRRGRRRGRSKGVFTLAPPPPRVGQANTPLRTNRKKIQLLMGTQVLRQTLRMERIKIWREKNLYGARGPCVLEGAWGGGGRGGVRTRGWGAWIPWFAVIYLSSPSRICS